MSIKTEDSSIYAEYYSTTKEYIEKYGEQTILLMQVGSFFEVYGNKSVITGDVHGSRIIDFTRICQLNMSEKKAIYANHQVVMAGFRDYALEKYLPKLVENNYTVVVYVQEKNEKQTKRVLHAVYSAGTYVSYENDSSPKTTNNIMCVWIEKYKPLKSVVENIIYGVSVVNIFTGQSYIFEHEIAFSMNPTTFDELERCMSIYSPCEVLFVTPFDNQVNDTILQYCGCNSDIIRKVDTREQTPIVHNCTKQTYIQHILSTFYDADTYYTCAEYMNHSIATQSFCYLLNFIQEHNPNLIQKISHPEFQNTSTRVLLANHTLRQLNIINDQNKHISRKLSSVLGFLNNTSTSMGYRLFENQLVNPTFDEDWITNEYNMIDLMKTENITVYRKVLSKVNDIDKIARQIVLKKIYPSSIYNLFYSIFHIREIYQLKSPVLDMITNKLQKTTSELMLENIDQFLSVMNTTVIIDKCKNVHSLTSFDENIIQIGVSKRLDDLVARQHEDIKVFQGIKQHLNNIMRTQDTSSRDTEYIKEHETEKSGTTLQITKTRSKLLKEQLTRIACSQQPYLIINENVKILASSISFGAASSSNVTIECSIINNTVNELLKLRDAIQTEITNAFLEFLEVLANNYYLLIEKISNIIANFDVIQCKGYNAIKYNYCRPTIDTVATKSYVNARELRHLLIEHINTNELYVPNDVILGDDVIDGILLFGTNAVGKTSLIRALGVSIILAQSGNYVPASTFVYKPYHSMFSRILGNDNLFKGLSTFAVEMSELRVILKMADQNSFIIGDEVCSGTETESALSIFTAALMELHNKRSSFIFATHFHEIVTYDEIREMTKCKMKHLAVFYDREHECLVYDRKLKDGSGLRTYGLEVAASMQLPIEFLDIAHNIRRKYFPEVSGALVYNTTRYSSAKIRGMCEMCKTEMAEETHHLQQQKEADAHGFIGTIHKNHPANLMPLCQKCHDKIHSQPTSVVPDTDPAPVKRKIVRKKTTKGYQLEQV
jgi:DNA mismatch repair protein MutS